MSGPIPAAQTSLNIQKGLRDSILSQPLRRRITFKKNCDRHRFISAPRVGPWTEPRALLAHELQPCAYHSAVSVLDPGFMNVWIYTTCSETKFSPHYITLHCVRIRETPTKAVSGRSCNGHRPVVVLVSANYVIVDPSGASTDREVLSFPMSYLTNATSRQDARKTRARG